MQDCTVFIYLKLSVHSINSHRKYRLKLYTTPLIKLVILDNRQCVTNSCLLRSAMQKIPNPAQQYTSDTVRLQLSKQFNMRQLIKGSFEVSISHAYSFSVINCEGPFVDGF